MAGEIAVQPIQPTFNTEKPKPQGLLRGMGERIKDHPLTKERRAKRATERARGKLSTTTLTELRNTRERGGKKRALNLHEDEKFKKLSIGEQAKIIQKKKEMGDTTPLTPQQMAESDRKAYESFVQKDPHAAEYYRRLGLYVTKPDKDGNCRVDYRADPFMRSIDAQVQALKNSKDPSQISQADAMLDAFVRDAKQKAEIYAAAGHKGLREALKRVDASPTSISRSETQTTPSMPAENANVAKPVEPTVQRIMTLSNQGKLTYAEQHELKELQRNHKTLIEAAGHIRDQLNDPNAAPLTSAQLLTLEQYGPLLAMQESATANGQKQATPEAKPAGQTTTETEAERKARETKERVDQKILGLNAFTELTSKLGDLSGETEQGMLDKLTKGEIKNPDGSVWQDDAKTQEYIKAAFTEKALLDATEAAIPQATRDKLKQNGLNILELLLAMATAAALTEAQKAIAITP
ncbi:MAG TPA: hypothetical protein PKG71_00455 [Candidatus Woesebacteria bacterium]|nr:hypothetical protein [Candidatus Woesebacteria bacterium]HNS94428.1 hypothetical protein [Candidatus Woesebacteria bacterium]